MIGSRGQRILLDRRLLAQPRVGHRGGVEVGRGPAARPGGRGSFGGGGRGRPLSLHHHRGQLLVIHRVKQGVKQLILVWELDFKIKSVFS